MKHAAEHVGETVKVGGWLTDKHSSGKITFLQLRDGSAYFQGIVVKSHVTAELYDLLKALHQESALYVVGTVQADSHSAFGYELAVSDLEIIGDSQDYPITPKEHGVDFLFDHRHLWLRSKRQFAKKKEPENV